MYMSDLGSLHDREFNAAVNIHRALASTHWIEAVRHTILGRIALFATRILDLPLGVETSNNRCLHE